MDAWELLTQYSSLIDADAFEHLGAIEAGGTGQLVFYESFDVSVDNLSISAGVLLSTYAIEIQTSGVMASLAQQTFNISIDSINNMDANALNSQYDVALNTDQDLSIEMEN